MTAQVTSGKFKHKTREVFAVIFQDFNGTIDLQSFPIKIEVTDTGKYLTDGRYGPLPLFEIKWQDGEFEYKSTIPHNTVILAQPDNNDPKKHHLEFMDYDRFFRDYKPV